MKSQFHLKLILLLALSGCGDVEIPVVTEATSGPGVSALQYTQDPSKGALRLTNACSSATISSGFLSPSSQNSWGPNQLAAAVAPGTNARIENIPPGTYDIQARSLGTYSVYFAYLFSIPITSGATYFVTAIDYSFSGSLQVTNAASGKSMLALYVSPVTSTGWGINQLSGLIGPSGYKHLYDVPAGNYDLRVVWTVGSDSITTGRLVSPLTLTSLTAN